MTTWKPPGTPTLQTRSAACPRTAGACHQLVEEWLAGQRQRLGFTIRDILTETCGPEASCSRKVHSMLGAALRRLGYERHQLRRNGKRVWKYFKNADLLRLVRGKLSGDTEG